MGSRTSPYTETEQSSSLEAQELVRRLSVGKQADSDGLDVCQVRSDLAAEFEPRAARAIDKYAPKLREESIGGVRCMIIDPPTFDSDDVILYFFGGGYISGDPSYELPIVAHLAASSNKRCVLPYYSLAPEHPYPAALNEALAVFDALAATSNGNIILGGESSGGGLAMSLLHQRCANVAALCLFSPWLDLTDQGLTECATVDDPSTELVFLETAVQSYCEPENRGKVSPALFDWRAECPPLYVSSGTNDIMRPTLQRFVAQLRAQGSFVDFSIWPAMWHVFELYDEVPEARSALTKAADFISNSTKSASC